MSPEGGLGRVGEQGVCDGFDAAAEEIRVTRKTLLELPDPPPAEPPAAKLPNHPAYQQIMAVFAAATAPLRARAVCEAMDVEIAPSNINNTRLKLKRLAERGILAGTEQGLFTLRGHNHQRAAGGESAIRALSRNRSRAA
ncbi:hypothetical protein [Kitasatospora sp. NPDC086791]|uniref:hypothetical protein n=1 Tax=Kitasatospora sp. NPDC086791 TaxID=3155178 RepID=UPI003416BD29